MITWMNQNQGFIMCVLTFVYVVATVIIVIMNRKSINEMETARLEESRPYIIANLVKDPRDRCFYLKIKNYGKTGAIINSFSVLPTLKLVRDSDKEIKLDGCMLAPNQSIQFIVLEEWEHTCKQNYEVIISYSSFEKEKRKFEEKYMLVTQYAHMMGYTDNKNSNLTESENALVNIVRQLDSIRNKM